MATGSAAVACIERQREVATIHDVVLAPPLVARELVVSAESLMDEPLGVTVIDTRSTRDYAAGHIPGAHSLPVRSFALEDGSAVQLRRVGSAMQQALTRRGVDSDNRLVFVDGGDGSASLGVFLAELAGATAAVLDGGMRSWWVAGAALALDHDAAEPGAWDGDLSFDTVATFEQVLDITHGLSDWRLIDARSQLEHEGIVGSPCCSTHGHIPGSLHLDWTRMLSATESLRPTEAIVDQAEQLGLDIDDDIVIYCHSSVRSAVAAIALRHAGFASVRNYLGSWHEWAARGLPVAPER